MNAIRKIEAEQLKENIPMFDVGDTIKVHVRVVEGDKERPQIFQGLVIATKGSGLNASYTVRKISYGEGVERVFPLHTPKVSKIEVVSRGKVRRARLHYLRERTGKAALQVKPQSADAVRKIEARQTERVEKAAKAKAAEAKASKAKAKASEAKNEPDKASAES